MTFCKTNDVKAARSDILSWQLRSYPGGKHGDEILRICIYDMKLPRLEWNREGVVAMLLEP
jgi:hypothetical protein